MQNTLGWGLDEIKWTECGSLLMLEDGHMEFIILLYFCECELFFPHNKLKKKKPRRHTVFVWGAPCGEL